MKKYILAIFGLLAITFASAQTSPRFGTLKNENNTGSVLTYGYQTPAYAASIVITAKAYETIVKPATLTGALSLTASVGNCKVGDKLVIVYTADGSNRTVTYSTNFQVTATTQVVTASLSANITFIFNGVKWQEVSRSILVN